MGHSAHELYSRNVRHSRPMTMTPPPTHPNIQMFNGSTSVSWPRMQLYIALRHRAHHRRRNYETNLPKKRFSRKNCRPSIALLAEDKNLIVKGFGHFLPAELINLPH